MKTPGYSVEAKTAGAVLRISHVLENVEKWVLRKVDATFQKFTAMS